MAGTQQQDTNLNVDNSNNSNHGDTRPSNLICIYNTAHCCHVHIYVCVVHKHIDTYIHNTCMLVPCADSVEFMYIIMFDIEHNIS